MADQPKDNFSAQAAAYAAYRPHYPAELYDFLYSLPVAKDSAWDCATGNGQVAAELANKYRQVYATDISEAQLRHAPHKENIRYLTCPAESTPLPPESIDLVTVAQAAHWFDFDRFYKEVRRVTKAEGWLAMWGYGLIQADKRLNPLVEHFYKHTTGPYWDEERRHLDLKYTSIPFPFPEIPAPEFSIRVVWTRRQLIGYLSSWSAVQHYVREQGDSPLPTLEDKIKEVWPGDEAVEFSFPIFMRVGRVK